jgi:hypothetical protein
MSTPSTPQELSCILNKLRVRGLFTYIITVDGKHVKEKMPDELIKGAISEFVTACEEAYFRSIEPTAMQRVFGLLFIPAIEAFLTEEKVTTVTEPDPS